MASADGIAVEVVVAMPDRQELCSLRLPPGTDAAGAVTLAGLRSKFPELDWSDTKVAVWGRVVSPEYLLADGDRVEVLRPLALDPRDARRTLARAGQFMGSAGSTDD